MKVGIDLRQLVLGASGGISQLVKGVCETAFRMYPEHQFFVFSTAFNRSVIDYAGKNIECFSLPVKSYFKDLDRIALENEIDILFRAYPMEDNLRFPLNKQIVLIPDNQHETYPEFFSKEVIRTRRVAFSKALMYAGAIGTISEFAREALVNFPETRCKDIFLMEPALQEAHASSISLGDLDETERAAVPRQDYVIFPANIWKHKNHEKLLHAFRILVEKHGQDITLVLTGHRDGWEELARTCRDLNVIHLGFIRPEFLRYLLEHARALVFFSLYEGFGIPLLEAFDAGVPVVCSNTTSLPEVGGDAVLSCDPTDVHAMAAAMQRVLCDVELRAAMIRKGKTRLGHYSWERSARNFIEACQRVASNSASVKTSPHADELPLVSIVTPSYNQGRFLKRTIESVLRQTYPRIEYFVMDGGSTDESVDILKSYGDRFYWVSEPDSGQTNAINKGMVMANGEILAYLNSDDVLLPDAVERAVTFFREHPDCDMVYGNADYIDEDDAIIGAYRTAEYSTERLMEDCMVCQPAAFWRQRVVDRIGLFDERLNLTMDYDYWLRIAKSGSTICFCPEKLACSRLYKETKTMSARGKIFKEIFEICTRHFGYVHRSYFQGYWHHLVHEKEAVSSRLLRLIPRSHQALSLIHHNLHRCRRYRMRQIPGKVYRKLTGELARTSSRFKFVGALLKPMAAVAHRPVPVTGFWPDNWLEERVVIGPKRWPVGHVLHIGGIAPLDVVMEVWGGANLVRQFTFSAHTYTKVTFPAEQLSNCSVTLTFSSFITDDANRHRAFQLHDTNLFSERETW